MFSNYLISFIICLVTRSTGLNLHSCELVRIKTTSLYPHQIPLVTSFTYLGIKISGSLANIMQDNYTGHMEKVSADVQRRSSLKISMQARVTILKMNVLPRFNYLFFTLPIQPPSSIWIKHTHSFLSSYEQANGLEYVYLHYSGLKKKVV